MGSGVKRPVWVGDRKFESVTAAAAYLGVTPGYACRKIGGEIRGNKIRGRAPRKRAIPRTEARGARRPLLVYPEGEHPLERGLPQKFR